MADKAKDLRQPRSIYDKVNKLSKQTKNLKLHFLSSLLGETSWPISTKKNSTTLPNMLRSAFSKGNSKKGSKSNWNVIKPFLTNSRIKTNDSIILEENVILKNEFFNNHYVETTSEK